LELGPLVSLAGLAASYLGQDLAHRLAGEPTFQSRYEERPSRFKEFFEHTYYLLPLCLDAAWYTRVDLAFLVALTPKNGLLLARLDTQDDLRDLTTVRDWVEGQNPPTDVTTHWWSNALDSP